MVSIWIAIAKKKIHWQNYWLQKHTHNQRPEVNLTYESKSDYTSPFMIDHPCPAQTMLNHYWNHKSTREASRKIKLTHKPLDKKNHRTRMRKSCSVINCVWEDGPILFFFLESYRMTNYRRSAGNKRYLWHVGSSFSILMGGFTGVCFGTLSIAGSDLFNAFQYFEFLFLSLICFDQNPLFR